MKSISAAAMKAIRAGEAIVTGSVEIVPVATGTYSYSTLGTVDIDAVANATSDLATALAVGTTFSGLNPSDRLRLSQPLGGTFAAWNYDTAFVNEFDVMLDGSPARSYRVSQAGIAASQTFHGGGYSTAAAARAAFGTQYLGGASSYTFFIYDSPIVDNTGGVSVKVERGVLTAGTPAPPIRLWGGHGPIEIEGQTYQGIGHQGLAQQSAGAVGGVAQGLTLSLSGVDPVLLDLLDAQEVKSATVVLRRLIFASDGKTLLDAHVFDRGRLDTLETKETIGGAAAIIANIESAARGLGRSGARMRADSDQRLIDGADGYFKNAAYAGEKMLYWGGKRPSRPAGITSVFGD